MMKRTLLAVACGWFLTGLSSAQAALTLLEKDDWKASVYGFVQVDAIYDSTRSFSESPGNTPVTLGGSPGGEQGRTQFSFRDSRFGFSFNKQAGEWATKGVLEMDFIFPTIAGFSEASLYGSSLVRARHAYLQAERNGWQLLAGQYWSLFGWQPTYVMDNDALPPTAGVLFQRVQQLTVMKNLEISQDNKLSVAAAVVRPFQRDAIFPTVDAGIRWAYSGRMAGLAAAMGGDGLQPLSVALSGRMNQFEYMPSADPTVTSHLTGYALALQTLVPILASTSGTAGTLSFLGSASAGKGYSESVSSYTGGLPAFSGSAVAGFFGPGTNIDAGNVGLDPANGPTLVNMYTFNAQLQYHLPTDGMNLITAAYGQLYSDNIGNMTGGGVSLAGLYSRHEAYFINFMHNFTKEIRGVIEFDRMWTTYVSSNVGQNNRIEFSFLYFF